MTRRDAIRPARAGVVVLALLLAAAPGARAHRPLVRIDAAAGKAPPGGGALRGAGPDTVFFGGDGSGLGNVVRGGVWSWEGRNPDEPPLQFPDGDPVGNEYRDGWRFLTSAGAAGSELSELGPGHWLPDGSYDFDDDSGSFAHRATFHPMNGADDGPDPLDDPDRPGASSWSVWIGTNLFLNPEHCGWERAAGYGNGWSQGIRKTFAIDAGAGTPIDLAFYHRYALESDFDTGWVEISLDGVMWVQVGSDANPQGIYNGGTRVFDPEAPPGETGPQPGADGGAETVELLSWPGGAGELHVRFRLAADAFFSDESDGGDFFYAWQLDDVALSVGGLEHDVTDFESGMNGWEPRPMRRGLAETGDRPWTRIDNLANVSCPILVACPEACGLDGNVLFAHDRDDCIVPPDGGGMAASPAFSIGGPENPDIDGWGGRQLIADVYHDGGQGTFETGWVYCHLYDPFNTNLCPWSPPNPGDPGFGGTFNWSVAGFPTCDFWIVGSGAACLTSIDDVSANLPAAVDSVIILAGVFTQCRSEPTCDLGPGPYLDNLRFAVYDPEGVAIAWDTIDRYADRFPLQDQAHQGMSGRTARADGGHSLPMCNLGSEQPLRWVNADTAVVETGAPNAALFLRFKVEPGPCTDLSNPFFAVFKPDVWNEARMDTGRAHGTGAPVAGTYMTCFHEDDPHDGASWGGEALPVEPCDDILPDGVLEAGTIVRYFVEARDATTGETIGTSPRARNAAAIDTTADHERFWREFEILPEVESPNCNDPAYFNNAACRPNNVLIIAGSPSVSARTRMRAFLGQFSIDYDWYDVAGASVTCGMYNGIGRREDRAQQAPRPPTNGATRAELEPYDCIWYFADFLASHTLSDETTLNVGAIGGQPSNDQQKLEGWLAGCAEAGENRLLIMDGYGWASDIDAHTWHGPAFLAALGTDVLAGDYEAVSGDLRRCARLEGVTQPGLSGLFDGEVFGTGCPDDVAADILAPLGAGELVAHYLDSLEGGDDPVQCADDVQHAEWAAIIRHAAGPGLCRRSVTMGVSFVRVSDLDCADQCVVEDWRLTGDESSPAALVAELFDWAGKPIGDPVDAPDPGGSPALVTTLIGAWPNPANPGARIAFTLARRGHVRLEIFDVHGRLVRTLIDDPMDPSPDPYEMVWDGRSNAGRPAASGVFFYRLDAPGHTAAGKLVLTR